MYRDKVCNNKFLGALNKLRGQRGMQNSEKHIWERHAACVTAYTRLAAKPWSAEQEKQQMQGCREARLLPRRPVQCLSAYLPVWQSLHMQLKTGAPHSMGDPEYPTVLSKLRAAVR